MTAHTEKRWLIFTLPNLCKFLRGLYGYLLILKSVHVKKNILILFILFAGVAESIACSCIGAHFCNAIRDSSVQVAVLAKIVRSTEYTPDNAAVYLQVLNNYKDESSITDTIKVYGNEHENVCFVDVLYHFLVGDTVIVAFGSFQFGNETLYNPDSLIENHYEVRPNLCYMILLQVENGIVYGPISQGVDAYPLSHFENALSTCAFPVVDLPELTNPALNFRIHPNPSTDGRLYISSKQPTIQIEMIRVFSIDGRLIRTYSWLSGNNNNPVEIELPDSGMHVLEIHAGGKVYWEKAVSGEW